MRRRQLLRSSILALGSLALIDFTQRRQLMSQAQAIDEGEGGTSGIPEAPDPVLTPSLEWPWNEGDWEWMYEGGDHSLIHLFIGGAEGTRGPNGEYWKAYYGHTDPGNQVWNKGSFSYQHGPNVTPAQADELQLARLRSQARQILQQAASPRLLLTPTAFLNALDLANQSPLAGVGGSGKFGSHGFINHLAWHVESGGARNGIYTRDDIVFCRVRSYIHPVRGTWTATGLNANYNTDWSDRISRENVWNDQQRRYDAGARALAVWANAGRIPEGFKE